MKNKDYMELAQRTSSTVTPYDKIMNAVLGLIGETGQVVDIVKKLQYQGLPHEKAKEKMHDEIGDVLWYCAEMCTGMNVTIPKWSDTLTPYDVSDNDRYTIVQLVMMLDDQASVIRHIVEREKHMPYMVQPDSMMFSMQTMLTVCNIILKRFCDSDMEMCMKANIDKLRGRYPTGFDTERSNNRK